MADLLNGVISNALWTLVLRTGQGLSARFTHHGHEGGDGIRTALLLAELKGMNTSLADDSQLPIQKLSRCSMRMVPGG